MWKRMEYCAAQWMQVLVTGGHSWPLAQICEDRNLISTSNLTPVLKNMRFDKMGAAD